MIRLIVKEWRQLLPIAWLWLAVLVLGYITKFTTERIDEQTFTSWCEGYCDYNSNVVVAFIGALFALVTAYSLFPREHDEATIDFLRAMPVSRRTIFVAKILAAWLLLCAINLFAYALDALLLASNPESIGGKFYPQVWSTLLWRDCVFAFVILSHGVLLSWFRTVGLIVYSIYLLLLMWAESQWGSSGLWSIFSLLSNEYDGSRLIVNSKGLAIHALVAVLILWVSYKLWSRSESSISGPRQSGLGMKLFQGALSIIGFVLLAGALAYQVGKGTGSGVAGDLKIATTAHYRFVYPAGREDTVSYMLKHVESDYENLAEILGIESQPSIRVDLSAQSEHAAGLATWKKIKMDLNSFTDDVSQRRVLSHETTHVLQAVESNRALAENFSAVKFFIEGMAQYTSFEVVAENSRRDSNWELAGVAWYRQNIEFNDMLDAAAFAERFDTELHYSLGDLWTRAFVSTCGEAALGDFIRAVGREGAVRDLPANVFWRDTTAAIGCDLDTINEHWRNEMSDLYESIPQSRFPMYTDVVINSDVESGQIAITAALGSANDSESDFDLPSRFIVRIGRSSSQLASGVDAIYRGKVVNDADQPRVEFLIPETAISGSRFRYQLGFTPSEDSRYFYELWRRGSI